MGRDLRIFLSSWPISDDQLQALGLSPRKVLLFGPVVRSLLLAAVLGVCYVQLSVHTRIAHATVSVRQGADFGVFYRSSERAARGADPYIVEPGDVDRAPNLNPPHVVLLLVPLTHLSPRAAIAVWATLSAASVFLALFIVFRELCLGPRALAWTLLALLCAAPSGAVLITAQVSLLLWAPFTFGWAAARRGRMPRAGLALGALISVKPFLAALIPLLARERPWRGAVVAVATVTLCFSAGMVGLGWQSEVSWLRAGQSVTWAAQIFNSSLFAFAERILSNRAAFPVWSLAPIVVAPALVVPLWIVGAVLVAAFSIRSVRRRRAGSPRDVDQNFAVVLSAALLVCPLAWIYYHFLLVGPISALVREGWREWSRWRRGLLVAGALCFALPPGWLATSQPSGWASATIGSAYFWGLLALWTCALEGVWPAHPRNPRLQGDAQGRPSRHLSDVSAPFL